MPKRVSERRILLKSLKDYEINGLAILENIYNRLWRIIDAILVHYWLR